MTSRLAALPGLLLLLLAALPAAAEPSLVLRHLAFPSRALGRAESFDLYLPPDRAGLAGLPVIYLLHGTESSGADWLDKGDLQAAADRLIRAGKLPRSVIVMPDAGNSWYVDAPPGDGLGAMGTALSRELPAWIEAHYPVSRRRGGRAVAGYSMGAFGALRFALDGSDRYVAAVGMSSALWTFLTPRTELRGRLREAVKHIFAGAFGVPFDPARFVAESPLTLVRRLPAASPRPDVLLISGRHEMFNAMGEQGIARAALAAAHVPVETALTDGNHDWNNWRPMLPRVLAFLGRHLRPPHAEASAEAGCGHRGPCASPRPPL